MRGPLAIGERTAESRGRSKSSRDAGNDLVRHTGFVKRADFFSRAAKEQRIAALEADHTAAGAGVLDHERVDLFLSNGFRAAALADVDNHCMGRSQIEDCSGTRSSWSRTSPDSMRRTAFTVSSSGSPGPAPTRRPRAGNGARRFLARPRQLARGAEGRVADLALRKLVQEQTALFSAGMRGEDFAAQRAELREPRAEILGKLLVDFAAQPLSNGRAFAGRRDGDLQVAAADHRAEEEVAVGNVVDAVAGDVARKGFAIDRRVDFGHIGSGDDDEVAVEIGGRKFTLDQFQFSLGGELADFRMGHEAQPRAA